jgi:hypothetical protein
MDIALQDLIYSADDHYLSDADLDRFHLQIHALAERIEVYEYIRDREVTILQPAADYLSEEFPNTDSVLLDRTVVHWLAILRYGAMAMLLNNTEFLHDRILEWLPDSIEVYQLHDIEIAMYRLLQVQLKNNLSANQLELLKPYLEEAYGVLLRTKPALQTTPQRV